MHEFSQPLLDSVRLMIPYLPIYGFRGNVYFSPNTPHVGNMDLLCVSDNPNYEAHSVDLCLYTCYSQIMQQQE